MSATMNLPADMDTPSIRALIEHMSPAGRARLLLDIGAGPQPADLEPAATATLADANAMLTDDADDGLPF